MINEEDLRKRLEEIAKEIAERISNLSDDPTYEDLDQLDELFIEARRIIIDYEDLKEAVELADY